TIKAGLLSQRSQKPGGRQRERAGADCFIQDAMPDSWRAVPSPRAGRAAQAAGGRATGEWP
ncbi:unnamed protein product, partial [Coccothraustes coccothraustes]